MISSTSLPGKRSGRQPAGRHNGQARAPDCTEAWSATRRPSGGPGRDGDGPIADRYSDGGSAVRATHAGVAVLTEQSAAVY